MRSRDDKGFTLLEVMVAFVIAAIAISALYTGVSAGLAATGIAAQTAEALDLAKSHLAAIGRGAAIAPQESSGVDGDGFSWRLSIKAVSTRHMTLSDSDRANDTKPTTAVLFDVEVTEIWQDRGHDRELRLATRRFDVQTAAGG